MSKNFEAIAWIRALAGSLCLSAAWPAIGQPVTYAYDGAGNMIGAGSAASGAPRILVPSRPQLMDSTSAAIFSVSAAGWALSYQWLSNGVPIPGARSDTLYVANLPLVGTNLGNFSVVVSNAVGVVTSTPAALWPDANSNALPDWWETTYFRNLNQASSGDFDRDGVSNLDEFSEGTNPTNKLSFNPRLYLQAANGYVSVSPSHPYYSIGQLVTLTAFPDPGQGFIGWSGAATGTKTTVSLIMNTNATVVANFGFPLGVALDNTNLVWTTTGSALWFGQPDVSADGISSAQSGPIVSYWDGANFVGDKTSLQTTFFISQPQQLGFWWTVSSQPPDGVSFLINNNQVAKLSGQSVAWQNFQTNLPAGVYTLTWTYTKGPVNIPDASLFLDAAWVDQVTIVPTLSTVPILQVQETGLNNILLSWPVSSPLFRLQETAVLTPPNWSNSSGTINVINGVNQVSVQATGTSRFYRLVYP